MKPYFITCREAMEARLLLQVRHPPPPEWELGVQGARVKGTHRSRSLSGDFLACVCLLCSVPRNPRSSESKQAF